MRRHGLWLVGTVLAMVIASLVFRPRTERLNPSPFTADKVRIATWNIGLEPVARRKSTLAKAIRAIGADIVLLVEFTPDSDLPQLLTELKRNGMGYQAKIVQSRGKQNLVYLVRTGISVANLQVWTDVQLGNNDHRPALVGQFRAGKFDFTLVGVHLKSKRTGSEDPNAIRDAQIHVLVQRLRNSLKVDRDLLLIGDYNMIEEEDVGQFEKLQSVGLKMLHFEVPTSTKSYFTRDGKGGSLLDGFAISRDAIQELIPSSFRVFPLHQKLVLSRRQYRTQISDHLPLVAEFDTRVDRDP